MLPRVGVTTWAADTLTGLIVGVLLWLFSASVLATTLIPGKDYLVVGEPTSDQAPKRLCDPAMLATLNQRVEVPAPEGGWSGAPQAVEVFNVFYGEVMISHGQQQVCGHMQDVRTRDSRFRSGIGMVLVPQAGDTDPIKVAWLPPLKANWVPIVRLGAPSPLQQEDTARLLVRTACMAIVLSLALSALMGFLSTRDRSFVIYVMVCTLLAIWQAVFSGLSGYPWPWLPVHDAAVWLVGTSLAAVAVVVHLLWRLVGGSQVMPATLPWVRGQAVVLLVLAVAMPFSPSWLLTGTAAVLDVYLAVACLAAVVVGVRHLRRPEVDSADGLVAVAPLLVAMCSEWLGSKTLVEYRVEILLLSVTWFLMIAAYSLNRRLGLLRRQRDELKYLAETDSLTGLPNRRAGLDQLRRYLHAANKDGRALSIGFLDIDLFKQINDRFGHDVGDEVLVAVANALAASVRERGDVVRMGGEEFLVMLPGADAATAMQRAETLRARVGEIAPQLNHPGLQVTASIGVADYWPQADDLTSLLRRADEAMYQAKRGGRNRVVHAGEACAVEDDVATV